MLVFDASSIIYAWDNYPIKQFPGLWEWMEKEIEDGKFKIPDVAYDEVGDNAPECQKWLKNVDIERLPITSGILSKALFIKNLLGIEEDQYLLPQNSVGFGLCDRPFDRADQFFREVGCGD